MGKYQISVKCSLFIKIPCLSNPRTESVTNVLGHSLNMRTVKLVLSGHSKRIPKIVFQYQLSLNAGQKYCRMLQGEHSAILSTFTKLPVFMKIFVLSIFELRLQTGCIVLKLFSGVESLDLT